MEQPGQEQLGEGMRLLRMVGSCAMRARDQLHGGNA